MLLRMSSDEIQKFNTEIQNLVKEIISLKKQNLFDEESHTKYIAQLRTKYSFFYNKSDIYFRMIIRDFSKIKNDNEIINTYIVKFNKDLKLLLDSLNRMSEDSGTHYDLSKDYEEKMRKVYFPKNLQ